MEHSPIIFNQNGKLVVSSRNVAEVFEKEHKNVLQDIRNVLSSCSQEFGMLNFQLTPYTHPQNGQTYSEYLLTKDGFTMLAMGYTGPKAMAFKEAYIKRFNEMEQQLKASTPISLRPYLEDAKFILDAAGVQGNQLAIGLDNLYKAETGKSLLALTGTNLINEQQQTLLTPTQIGKEIGVSAIEVNKRLCAAGLQKKVDGVWVVTELGKKKGATVMDTGKRHHSGAPVTQVKWPADILAKL